MNTLLAALLAVAAAAVPAAAASASAAVKGTTEGSSISGTARFEDAPDGLKVTVQLTGVPPGVHGIHIHEKGSCADSGAAAGPHFNPDHAKHGLVTRGGPTKAHAGDLGNVTADKDGVARLELVIPHESVSGENAVAGRSIVLHEKGDDFRSQPAGDSGSRIACGEIR